MGAGTLEVIATQLSLILEQLQALLSGPNPGALFTRLGLTFPAAVLAQPSIANPLNDARTAATTLTTKRTALQTAITGGDALTIISAGLALLETVGTLIATLDTLANAIGSLSPATVPGVTSTDLTAYSANFSRRLVADMAISYMSAIIPTLTGVLELAGLLDNYPDYGDSSNAAKPAYMVRDLHLDRLSAFMQGPTDLLKTLYGWGDPTWDAPTFLGRISAFLGALGMVAKVTSPSAGTYVLQSLFLDIKPDTSVTPEGLTATLHASVDDGYTTSIPLATNWTIDVAAHGTIAGETGLTLAPPVRVAFLPPSGTLNGDVTASLAYGGSAPLTLIGVAGGSRLEVASVSIGAGLALTWDPTSNSAAADLMVQGSVTGGKAVIDMNGADGFLATVLSGVNVQAAFELAVTWRADSGLHIQGGAQLEIDLPLHLDLGPVTLPTLYLVGGLSTTGATLEVSAALGLTLGPIAASVDRVGLLGTLTFPAHGGNLGFANLGFAFKPPNGIGLSIDAGVIAGGGYISFDTSKGQYSGVLALSLLDTIGITVIAVLDTQMPDGSSGFALLFIITFTLPPIQLGFGFTLVGVGGLGGVNRTMNTPALQAGFMAHTLGDIMFPANPIANAAQIISDIESFFPPAEGRYLFGPLLQFGWGTPTLISLTIGAILSVPDPIVIALLGLVDAGLPTQDLALIELHIEILGIIDFGAKYLSIEGTLYDSSVLIFSMGGSLAFELSWGDSPNFVFSLGGFNPTFNTDGLNLPTLARCSVSIGDGDNPRISANNYFAVTSNSYQFGANVQAYASAAGFTVQGYLGFDVLLIISPFSFEFDFQVSFSVAFEGFTLAALSVSGLLSGPTPWHFEGSASITLLFFTVSASISLTWGDSTQATIPSKPVLPDLFTALDNPQNWSATLPPGAAVGVSLVTLKPTDTTLRVHPMGTLTVREKVVPLDVPITRYGNAMPSDGTAFSIQSVQINAQTETIQSIRDLFAIGQFETLSDADKLSKPSFEDYDTGVVMGSSAVASGEDRARTVTYQEYYIDAPTAFSRFSRLYQMPAGIHMALSAQGAGFTSALKNTGMAKYSAGPQPAAATVDNPPYVIASVLDLSVRADISSGDGTTYYQAQAALKSHLAANPDDIGNLQILPLYEVAA